MLVIGFIIGVLVAKRKALMSGFKLWYLLFFINDKNLSLTEKTKYLKGVNFQLDTIRNQIKKVLFSEIPLPEKETLLTKLAVYMLGS